MKQNTPITPKISKREQDVLRLLAKGNSRKMIASELDLTDHTIHSYFKRIYQKLEVNSATQAICKLNDERIASQMLD